MRIARGSCTHYVCGWGRCVAARHGLGVAPSYGVRSRIGVGEPSPLDPPAESAERMGWGSGCPQLRSDDRQMLHRLVRNPR
jgi:hypothetical protein